MVVEFQLFKFKCGSGSSDSHLCMNCTYNTKNS